MRRALVTGASGFVGLALCRRLIADGWAVRASTRSALPLARLPVGAEAVVTGDLGPSTEWSEALADIDVVFHLAARAHLMREIAEDPLVEFRRVNTAGTECLARATAAAGARRLVFVSSVKVNGEGRERAYGETDPPAPEDPYGVSKLEAEEALACVARASGLEVVVVRSPLVYGAGVKANVQQLLRAIDRGLPLPLGRIENRRSLIYVENLVDSLVLCATDERAAGRTYLVSDGEDVSTSELVRRIAIALRRPARLVPVPPLLLVAVGRLTGRRAAVQRLLGSLTVDSARIRDELGWRPPFTMAEGLRRTVSTQRDAGQP